MDEQVGTFQAITGASAEEAAQMLAMSDNNLETAVSLFFSMSGDAGAGFAANPPPQPMYEPFTLVWGSATTEIPESWNIQPLTFDGIGLPQLKNGPCGVLAVIQATVISEALQGMGKIDPVETVSDVQLSSAIASILKLSASEGGPVQVAAWKSDEMNSHKDIQVTPVEQDQLSRYIANHIEMFKSPGGLVLIVYSAVLTRGKDAVLRDIAAGTGEAPLIYGQFNLCTSELMSLLMRGVANGNVSAYSPTGTKQEFETSFGMLSMQELETGVPLADSLKFPQFPVWVLHGGDHFTVMFHNSRELPEDKQLTMFCYNGLPPGGPRLAQVVISAPEGDAQPAPAKHSDTFFKPVPGEIEDVVQADASLRKEFPKDVTKWKFEAVLAIDDPSVKGAERPSDKPAKVFPQGPVPSGAWRCATCYRNRFQTMCFGQNDGGSTCQTCGQNQADAGYSIWLEFSELPQEWQDKMMRRHAPRVLPVCATRWPRCHLVAVPETEDLPAV